MSNGKGSKRRPEKGTQYQDNWEKIFNKKIGKNVPIKIKKSQKIKDKKTGKDVTTHYYAKCATIEELHQLIANERTQLKIKNKCRNELIRRNK